jgi:hypothetical protein
MFVALIALFISLGGASYAVVSLPPHSVGTRQLQRGAVTLDTLGFPLGAASVTDPTPEDLKKGNCDGVNESGETIHAICPPRTILNGLFGNVPTLRLYVRRPGHLAILGTVALDNQGAPGTHASVYYAAGLDQREPKIGDLDVRFVTLLAGEQAQAPIDDLISVARGTYAVELRARAQYSTYEGGDVIVRRVSLMAVLLP